METRLEKTKPKRKTKLVVVLKKNLIEYDPNNDEHQKEELLVLTQSEFSKKTWYRRNPYPNLPPHSQQDVMVLAGKTIKFNINKPAHQDQALELLSPKELNERRKELHTPRLDPKKWPERKRRYEEIREPAPVADNSGVQTPEPEPK